MVDRRLLTEHEVAQLLRCSSSKIKRLRLAGHLAFVPGRPVLIEMEDVERYIEKAKSRSRPKLAIRPPPVREESGAERALRIWNIRQLREQMKRIKRDDK